MEGRKFAGRQPAEGLLTAGIESLLFLSGGGHLNTDRELAYCGQNALMNV